MIHATCCATTLAAYSMERHWSLQGRDMLTSRDSDPPFTSTRELTQILAETLDTSGFPFSHVSLSGRILLTSACAPSNLIYSLV